MIKVLTTCLYFASANSALDSKSRRRALAFPQRFPVGLFLLFAAGGSIPVSLFAGSDAGGPRPEIEIPRVQRPPKLEDFLDMKPNREMDGQLAKVEGFKQFSPKDGEPASQLTEVYLGYDDENLYLVWVCFDSEPHIRLAHGKGRKRS